MSTCDNLRPCWEEEFSVKPMDALLDRLLFHGSLRADYVRDNTGYSIQTVRKWFRKLVASGKAFLPPDGDVDCILDNPLRPVHRSSYD